MTIPPDPIRTEPHAVLLVHELLIRFGPLAFRVAQRRGDVAERQGLIGEADLYRAACVILRDGQHTYSRLRRASL